MFGSTLLDCLGFNDEISRMCYDDPSWLIIIITRQTVLAPWVTWIIVHGTILLVYSSCRRNLILSHNFLFQKKKVKKDQHDILEKNKKHSRNKDFHPTINCTKPKSRHRNLGIFSSGHGFSHCWWRTITWTRPLCLCCASCTPGHKFPADELNGFEDCEKQDLCYPRSWIHQGINR